VTVVQARWGGADGGDVHGSAPWRRATRDAPTPAVRARGAVVTRVAFENGAPGRGVLYNAEGVPFFALSDADRASEMRGDAETVREAALSAAAVLLPFTAGAYTRPLISPT
jgi:hypothetical protein